MASTSDYEEDPKRYSAPYTAQRPIPTIQHYREIKDERRNLASAPQDDDDDSQTDAENKNTVSKDSTDYRDSNGHQATDSSEDGDDESSDDDESDVDDVVKDTSEALSSEKDPKAKRKNLVKRRGDRAERVVTDPVTHLPIKIHDFTKKDLKKSTAEEKFDHPEYKRSQSSISGPAAEQQLKDHAAFGERTHREMERLFPPPNFDVIKVQLARTHSVSLIAAASAIFLFSVVPYLTHDILISRLSGLIERKSSKSNVESLVSTILFILSGVATIASVVTVRFWNLKRVDDIWQNSIWESERRQGRELGKSEAPESTHWLNALMGSIWPLINPDLFISLADTLEDVMQASLPKLVRMISVEDIGQGSEAFRVLGVRWLPKGAATRTVTEDGKLQKDDKKSVKSDRSVPGEGSIKDRGDSNDSGDEETESAKKRREEEEEQQKLAEGMQAEEGDFVNLELALAFRTRLSTHGLRSRSNNPHLYLAFYLPANVKLPVWVEVRGFIATVRVRLQLTPDPPFFSICTLTFLGQPKVDLSCVPLVKKGLNIMDLPVISHFVQGSVDAAMAEYVAPKSLTLDLKNMLVGDDFKKDTMARGILVVRIKHATGFKEGDAGIGSIKQGSTDGYVTVGWAKFGKAVWSTRVIQADMNPVWEEIAYVTVTPQELNVHERLRVQLWDSDRLSADDDLGRIEVDLHEIMTNDKSKNNMWDREDGFRALKAGQAMPGTLNWSVGYYPKTKLLDEQLRENEDDPEIKTVEDLRKKVYKESERKLREASKDESDEIEQQKKQDFKEKQDEMIIACPPPKDYPSGVLSVVIHQIQGLELESLNKREADKKDSMSDEQEEGGDLPSSYCTIILNHQKIYETRTKPKNSMPFFNAGTERFVPDIHNAHVHIAVRDARVHEDDPLIGVVDLPLSQVFEKRSQVNGLWPLGGGLGFGQVRISMVFRPVQLQAPRQLLGWEYGTLEIQPEIKGEVSAELQNCKIKARSNVSTRKFNSQGNNSWKSKTGKEGHLAVKRRYASCVTLEFRSGSSVKHKTSAFAILWLKDIPDDEDQILTLTVWKGDLTRARANACEEFGEKVGQIEVKLKFWSGLSGYHLPLAKRDPNVESVMEVLDCANDVNDEENMGEDASSSDSGSDEDESKSGSSAKTLLGKDSDLSSDGKRGVLSELEEYKQNRKQLHRRNRGLMQWKAPRTIKWMQHKLASGERKATKILHHHETGAGIETEV